MERSYEALRDVEFTLELLEQCEGDMRKFRILFVACLTLLRTTGQVLVHKTADPCVKKVALNLFDEHKGNRSNHKIYFDFIDAERGLIVHEYTISLEENDIEVVYDASSGDIDTFNLGDPYRPLADDKTFDGQDVRDLIKEAIEWWKVQLKTIKQRLS